MATWKMKEPNKYSLKFDDLLLSMLKGYHNLDASEVASFFGERAKEMLKCEPNITNQSRSPKTVYMERRGQGKTVTMGHKHYYNQKGINTSLQKMDVGNNKVYVLRGFYPDSHIPFKMTLVQFDGIGTARGKVLIGLKDHHTKIESDVIEIYNEAAAEAILLSAEVPHEAKIDYKYRQFKCMRPKGMELYREASNE